MNSIREELQQNETLRRKLLFMILNSKRLLSDHVEILEECLAGQVPATKSNLFTVKKLLALCLTSGVVVVHIPRANTSWWTILPAVCTGYGSLCAAKYFYSRRDCSTAGILRSLLEALDVFERCIKKNIMFLNERAFLKAALKSEAVDAKEQEVLTNCIQSIIDIIFVLYKDLKILETACELPTSYEPFEDIENCEMLKSDLVGLKPSKIKDYYNVFAYTQSQYLLCRGLVLLHGKLLDPRQVCGTLASVILEKSKDMTKLIEIKPKVDSKPREIVEIVLAAPLRDLRKSSVQFSMKMSALLHEFQTLDGLLDSTLQRSANEATLTKELISLESNFETIANEMPILLDDYQRLFITYKKYLNSPIDQLQSLETPTVEPEKPGKVYSGDTVEPQTDDFFAVDGFSDSDVSDGAPTEPHELENVNAKVAKRYFQPVLKQLKQKIEPLGEAMKERERKVLKAKGIEVVDIDEQRLSDSGSDSDDSNDTGRMRRMMKKSDQRYGDGREYLANKEQVNIFMRLPVLPSVVTEDVLE